MSSQAPIAQRRPQPPVGAMARTSERYGKQRAFTWVAPDVRRINLLTLDWHNDRLWRITVKGRLSLRVSWGTGGNKLLVAVRAPLCVTLPGRVSIDAEPIDDQGTTALVTAELVSSAGGDTVFRRVLTGPIALEESASSYFALTASNLLVAGNAVAVPALSRCELVPDSSIVDGTGLEEHCG